MHSVVTFEDFSKLHLLTSDKGHYLQFHKTKVPSALCKCSPDLQLQQEMVSVAFLVAHQKPYQYVQSSAA